MTPDQPTAPPGALVTSYEIRRALSFRPAGSDKAMHPKRFAAEVIRCWALLAERDAEIAALREPRPYGGHDNLDWLKAKGDG